MAKIISLPDGSEAEFPDSMSDDEIGSVLRKQFPPAESADVPSSPSLEPTGWKNLGRQLGLSARAGANVLASPLVVGGNVLNKTINALGGNLDPDLQGIVNRGLNAAGFPEPRADRPIEQVAQSMAQSAPAVVLPGRILLQALGNAALSASQAPAGQEAPSAALGGAVGAVGQGLARGLGGIITPSLEAVKLLRNKVALTPGQIQGGWLREAEGALAQTPVIGKPMRNRIAESRDSWQQSVMGDVLPPRASPEDAANISSIQDAFTQAYEDSVNMAKFKPGSAPVKDPAQLALNAKKLVPEATAEQVSRAKKLVEDLLENGGNPHTPASMQQVESRLKTTTSKYKFSPDPEQKIYGDLLDNISDEVRDGWRGSLTNTKRAELAGIDAQYRKFLPVQSAAGKGMANLTGEELPGSFTPQSLLKELRAGEKGARKSQWFAGERPLQDTATAAENVIGSKERPVSTMARMAGLAGLIGTSSGLGMPTALGSLVAAGAYGTKPVQKALTSKFATGERGYQKYLAEAIRKFAPGVSTELNKE